MSNQPDTYSLMLQPYGIDEEESRIYFDLLKNGFSPVLGISRRLHIGRTKVYRLLDNLIKKQLIEKKFGDRGVEFGAASPQRLKQLAAEKEMEGRTLVKSSELLVSELEKIVPHGAKHSKVLYYEGRDGLKQVNYNTIHAKKELRVFEVEHMSSFMDARFAEKIRQKQVENKIKTFDLTNKKSFRGFTNVTELVEKYSEFRYVDPKDMSIQFEVLIYNDVYATYTYKNDEIFCVEIYNEQLAQMQKQLFDFIWNKAKRMKFIDKRGAATVA